MQILRLMGKKSFVLWKKNQRNEVAYREIVYVHLKYSLILHREFSTAATFVSWKLKI